MVISKTLALLYQKMLSDTTKTKSERVILVIAIASFLIHLCVIYLVDFGIIALNNPSDLLRNPVAAIYTPFSFILVYEVYLLVHYLPKSITTYIGKQYEIISLIIIRRLFKDLSNLSLSANWFQIKYDLEFTYDLVASMLLFLLIYLFYAEGKKRYRHRMPEVQQEQGIARFIRIKKAVAVFLVPVLLILALYSLVHWTLGMFGNDAAADASFKNINNIFFDQFFTILIIVDVLLLLFSFFHTDEFHKVMRNSGFVISTILIRLSFSVTGLLNTALIVSGIVFGWGMLVIHNRFEKHLAKENGVV